MIVLVLLPPWPVVKVSRVAWIASCLIARHALVRRRLVCLTSPSIRIPTHTTLHARCRSSMFSRRRFHRPRHMRHQTGVGHGCCAPDLGNLVARCACPAVLCLAYGGVRVFGAYRELRLLEVELLVDEIAHAGLLKVVPVALWAILCPQQRNPLELWL